MTAVCPGFSRSVPISDLPSPCQTTYSDFLTGKGSYQIFRTLDQHINPEGGTIPNGVDNCVSGN